MIGRVLFFIDAPARGFGVLNSPGGVPGTAGLTEACEPALRAAGHLDAELVEHVVDQRAKRSLAVTDCASAASGVDDHVEPADAGEAAGKGGTIVVGGEVRAADRVGDARDAAVQQLAGGLGGAATGAETGTADGDDEVRASDNRGFDGVPD